MSSLSDVVTSNWIAPAGPHLEDFQEQFARQVGTPHALAVSSGTAALHLAMRYLGIGPGDDVLCSTLTFCASANPITYEGGTPVFIDSDRETWNMDPNLLEDELRDAARRGKLPRAIVVVDIFGQSADFDAINETAARYDIPVIDDAAEALGALYKGRPMGSHAWANVFSFNGNKIITTGGGGMLCSTDSEFIAKARHLATQARDPAPHYQHSVIGFNYRMSNVLAAIGLSQLSRLDERVQARRRHFEHYRRRLGELPGVTFMPEAPYGTSNRWLTVILIDERQCGVTRESLRLELERNNIESRPVWKPLHLQPVFAGCRVRGGAVAERIFEGGLCLPSGSAMTPKDLDRVCDIIQSVVPGHASTTAQRKTAA
jgi:pyridoxal phosphate-dependent aminotransferase EpsN